MRMPHDPTGAAPFGGGGRTPEEIRDSLTPDQQGALARLSRVAGARYEQVYPARIILDALARVASEDVSGVMDDICALIGVPPDRPVALPS